MKKCKRYRRKLVLYLYDELDAVDRADLDTHLIACADCQKELTDLKQLKQVIPERPLFVPSEARLQILRNAIGFKIKSPQKAVDKNTFLPFGYKVTPAFQIAYAALILVVGFFIGRATDPAKNNELSVQSLLTAGQQIRTANAGINPFLANVEKIKFDAPKGTIEIHYNTVNDVYLRGDLRDAAVRDMVQHALLQEANPTVRLHAIKAVNAMVLRDQVLEPQLLEALTYLLEKDQSQGVRLQVLRVLKVTPLSPIIKSVLMKVLLTETDTALRIEAFRALTRAEVSLQDMDDLLPLVKEDSSGYIRYRAGQMIDAKRKPIQPDQTIERSKSIEKLEEKL